MNNFYCEFKRFVFCLEYLLPMMSSKCCACLCDWWMSSWHAKIYTARLWLIFGYITDLFESPFRWAHFSTNFGSFRCDNYFFPSCVAWNAFFASFFDSFDLCQSTHAAFADKIYHRKITTSSKRLCGDVTSDISIDKIPKINQINARGHIRHISRAQSTPLGITRQKKSFIKTSFSFSFC